MNEHGKDEIKFLSLSLAFMFILLSFMPLYEVNGGLPVNDFTEIQVSECIFWAYFFFCILSLFYGLSHFISTACCYLVYFVQRYWYLRKLRKPERVYTGDPL